MKMQTWGMVLVLAFTGAAWADDDEGPKPSRRKREVIEITVMLERCRAALPGFAERSEEVYQAWRARHGATLNEFDRSVGPRIRQARRSTMPSPHCTDEWLQEIAPLAQAPDPRFSSVEKTWTVFVEALKAADRATAMNCLTGRAETQWKSRVEKLSNEDLRRIGVAIRSLRIQWGDDYMKEGIVEGDDKRVGAVAFRNRNEEWKIQEL
ncbi:MAG TPA: hypothetical protein VNB23_14680 [Ramlibacter sp.]|nr:hypothetical protein [Ramlibacter sp.]